MAYLSTNDGQIRLRWRHRIGRGPHQDLHLDSATISADHAIISWGADGWSIRDLGSTNGTWIGSERVIPAEPAALVSGDVLNFGALEKSWTFFEQGAPRAFALESRGDVEAESGLLALPPQAPRVAIFHDWQQGWVLERDGLLSPVVDRERVQVGGHHYTLHLPDQISGTLESPPGTIQTVDLAFSVSRDEERVSITAGCGPRHWDLGAYERHYTLLTLARQRLGEGDGWTHFETLRRMLKIEENALDQHVHRARHQLAKLGILGAAGLVERRVGRELRIGIPPDRLHVNVLS